jgi:hypothetical protein
VAAPKGEGTRIRIERSKGEECLQKKIYNNTVEAA